MTTHAEILALVDQLAPLETSLERSAALWADRQSDDPQIAYGAAERAATFYHVIVARQLLTCLAEVARVAADGGELIPRAQLREILNGKPAAGQERARG